jgi:hypothetical protein
MLSLLSRGTFLEEFLTHLLALLVCTMSAWVSEAEEVCIRALRHLLINIEFNDLADLIPRIPSLLRIPHLI